MQRPARYTLRERRGQWEVIDTTTNMIVRQLATKELAVCHAKKLNRK